MMKKKLKNLQEMDSRKRTSAIAQRCWGMLLDGNLQPHKIITPQKTRLGGNYV